MALKWITHLFTKFGMMMITLWFFFIQTWKLWNISFRYFWNQLATSTFSIIFHTATHITRNFTGKGFKLSAWDPNTKSLAMKDSGGSIMQSRYKIFYFALVIFIRTSTDLFASQRTRFNKVCSKIRKLIWNV